MKTGKLILVLSLCFFLMGCQQGTEDPVAVSLQQARQEAEQEKEMFNFVIPDSIEKLLVVAVYYELDTKAHGMIVYKDTNKIEAFNFLFHSDGKVQRDQMKQKKFNEFSSVFGDVQYQVKPGTVVTIIQSGLLSNVREDKRIDNNNTYRQDIPKNAFEH